MDSCSLNEPCSLTASPSAVLCVLRCAALPFPACRPPPPPSPVACEVRCPDDARLRAQLGDPHAWHLAVRPRGDPLVQRAHGRLTQQLARGGYAAAEDEHA